MENNTSTTLDYKLLTAFCFDVIITTLKKKSLEDLRFPEEFSGKTSPVFVTWYKGKDKDLRGCIGTFTPDDLQKNLTQYSYFAAFKDSRFPPIALKEVDQLQCGVSLLVEFEDGKDAYDWEVGKHGITIDFKDKHGKKYHGTFLPEVASDRDWDKDTTLNHLIQKTGFYGKLTDVVNEIKLARYQSIKVTMSYDEYAELRKGSDLLL
jgi:uncharacterized protein (TIGR00296 family)